MKVLFYLLFFLSITCPASHAESTFNMNDAFVIAKARKLGHSAPFSFGESSPANGSSSYRFECHDSNCKTCNYNTGICSTCNPYYFLSGRLCKSCSSISVSNGVCTNCSATGSCTQVSCNKGYINKDGTCKTCSQLFSKCAECNSTKCTKCQSDKWLNNGKCVDCPRGATCNGTEDFTCNSTYVKSGNRCLRCPTGCTGCVIVSGTTVACNACDSRFRLDDRPNADNMCRPRSCDDRAGLVWPQDWEGVPGYYTEMLSDGLRAVCRNGSGCRGWARCNGADMHAYDY